MRALWLQLIKMCINHVFNLILFQYFDGDNRNPFHNHRLLLLLHEKPYYFTY